MTFIGESPLMESYVVVMCRTRGRFDFPGIYRAKDGRAKDGKLRPISFDGSI